jgi:hypothetical protein
MKIEFDWKIFETEKPIVGSKVIFQYQGKLILGIYNGDTSNNYPKIGMWSDNRQFPIYNFVGSEITPKSFNKKSQLSYPIYTPFAYRDGYNPYNFKWGLLY